MFPALPAPRAGDATAITVAQFLLELHGPPGQGVKSGAALSDFDKPRQLAVDVRSPSEYSTGHIPGAVNVPLFTDDGRAAVGTTYARKGRQAAIRLGLEEIGPQLPRIVKQVEAAGATSDRPLLVYCWRGGMRSGSVGWLLTLCGFRVHLLEGGYRSYRRWCKTIVGNKGVAAPCPVVVLGGCTGVGKTAVLHELKQYGEQILDLEGLANHRGSAFGSIGMESQPTNEAFENVVALAMWRANPHRRVWIEHEGQHVGKVLVPFGLAGWVQEAPGGAMVVMDMAKELRVDRLVEDYIGADGQPDKERIEALQSCVSKGLAKKLGGNRVKEVLAWLDEGRFSDVAAMLLGYYDKLYLLWESQSLAKLLIRVDCPTADAAANAKLVLAAAESSLPVECSFSGTPRSKMLNTSLRFLASGSSLTAAALMISVGTSFIVNTRKRCALLPAAMGVGAAATALLLALRSAPALTADRDLGVQWTVSTPKSQSATPLAGRTLSEATFQGSEYAGSTTCGSPASAATGQQSRTEVEQEDEMVFHGKCFCGEIRITCRGQPRSTSFCHCSICRRLSGAPFTTQALFQAEKVDMVMEPGASLQTLQTSRAVERQRCASCQTPVQGSVLGGKLKAVPLSILSPATGASPELLEVLRPKVHLHYADRAMDVRDGLPKYRAGAHNGTLLPESDW